MTFGPVNAIQSYLPPEQDFPEDNKLFREILSQRERITADILNVKENAQYEKVEILTGQTFFTTQTGGNIPKSQNSFRLTFDLVALKISIFGGVDISVGTTTLPLSSITQPSLIQFVNAIIPVHGFGAATTATNFYFINDPDLFVRTNNMTTISQNIIIQNNTGLPLTQAYWIFEYLKT